MGSQHDGTQKNNKIIRIIINDRILIAEVNREIQMNQSLNKTVNSEQKIRPKKPENKCFEELKKIT